MWTTRKSQRLSLIRRANGFILLFTSNLNDNNISMYRWKVGLLKYFGNIVFSHRYRSSASTHHRYHQRNRRDRFQLSKNILKEKTWKSDLRTTVRTDPGLWLHDSVLLFQCLCYTRWVTASCLKRVYWFNVTYYWRQTSFFV